MLKSLRMLPALDHMLLAVVKTRIVKGELRSFGFRHIESTSMKKTNNRDISAQRFKSVNQLDFGYFGVF